MHVDSVWYQAFEIDHHQSKDQLSSIAARFIIKWINMHMAFLLEYMYWWV